MRLGAHFEKSANLSTVPGFLASPECCILPSDSEMVSLVDYFW